MTPHEKSLKIIEVLNLNSRQIGEILGVNTRTASYKIEQKKYNKFTDANFEMLSDFAKDKIEKLEKMLNRF